MFQFSYTRPGQVSAAAEADAKLEAINKSQAIIEFAMDGTIIRANKNFLAAVGYGLQEILGRHHSMFVEAAERDSIEYRQFWERLNRGDFQSAEYKRVGKGGKEVWIQASYNPLIGRDGKPYKVVKFATDITQQKQQNIDFAGKMTAIDKAQAVIEFNPDGTIITANPNFLSTVGHSLSEIQGHHHSMFVAPDDRDGAEYRAFWAKLNRGEYAAGEFKRVAKSGKEIWLQASYNPILAPDGQVVKVVKFATDLTETKLRNAETSGQLAAIGRAQAVIEFNLDGTIITANENFLKTLGYRLEEIQGKHHSMFVESGYAAGSEYKQFWAKLNNGEHHSGEFKRIGKNGNPVWIQAAYSPILDMNGKPFKVVKFASDITAQVLVRQKNEHVRALMETVAAGAEELNVSVKDIASSMVKSEQTANEAVTKVDAANQSTQKLAATANSMTGIVTLIQKIADQINLLALNATIESARAGEAGRGFAVVAQEVKTLAGQAKAATAKITTEIDGVLSVSAEVAKDLEGINQAINSVQEYVASTSIAVDQQSTVAAEMSAQMQRAAAEAAGI